MAPSLIVMVREAVVVSATHGCLYLLIHCTVGALRASIEYFDKINRPNTPIGQKSLISPTVQWVTVVGNTGRRCNTAAMQMGRRVPLGRWELSASCQTRKLRINSSINHQPDHISNKI